MPIKYQPLGIPATSSFAIKANGTFNVGVVPPTASFAQFTTDPAFTGPKGAPFVVVTGSIVSVTPPAP
jgi:hypothetical protein